MSSGQEARIGSLQLCVGHREPMSFVDSAIMVADFGIEGDRHAGSEGARAGRQVLLIDQETLDAFGLARSDVRENVTTAGIDLSSLPTGGRLALGDEAVLEITGHCAPCARMDEIGPGLREQLEGKRGMLARVAQGGAVRVGDSIRVLETATP